MNLVTWLLRGGATRPAQIGLVDQANREINASGYARQDVTFTVDGNRASFDADFGTLRADVTVAGYAIFDGDLVDTVRFEKAQPVIAGNSYELHGELDVHPVIG